MFDKEKVIKGLEHCIRESEHIDDNPSMVARIL